jgi:cytoskeletal protein CcmA (bactofilin family)
MNKQVKSNSTFFEKVIIMTEITYISEELVMEGNLDSAGSSVVVAGRFKGELRAKDVLLEANSIFDGNLVADKVTLGGLVKGEVSANTLNVASSAKVEGNLKTNALSIDLGAEVSGSITRISK